MQHLMQIFSVLYFCNKILYKFHIINIYLNISEIIYIYNINTYIHIKIYKNINFVKFLRVFNKLRGIIYFVFLKLNIMKKANISSNIYIKKNEIILKLTIKYNFYMKRLLYLESISQNE